MEAIANSVPAMSADSEDRLNRAMNSVRADEDGPGLEESIAKRDELLALA